MIAQKDDALRVDELDLWYRSSLMPTSKGFINDGSIFFYLHQA